MVMSIVRLVSIFSLIKTENVEASLTTSLFELINTCTFAYLLRVHLGQIRNYSSPYFKLESACSKILFTFVKKNVRKFHVAHRRWCGVGAKADCLKKDLGL